jgi:hypothetical protein
MPKRDTHGTRPELKVLVAEASRALTTLDAARLEELALCCAALNRELENADSTRRIDLTRQARDAQADLAVFGRILAATRANIAVVERIVCDLDGNCRNEETEILRARPPQCLSYSNARGILAGFLNYEVESRTSAFAGKQCVHQRSGYGRCGNVIGSGGKLLLDAGDLVEPHVGVRPRLRYAAGGKAEGGAIAADGA